MTNDILCGYSGDREAMLMAYLYDDMPPDGRAAFEGHLASCARCRSELNGLEGVRAQLARWTPPEAGFAFVSRQSSPPPAAPHRWWREMPVWTQVAAAMLVLGVSAGVANLDVRYDKGGLSVRTGWSKPSAPNLANPVNQANLANPANLSSPWRSDLTALERQLRSDLRALQVSTQASGPAAAPAAAPNDAELLRRVKALVEDGERRQQRELALRVAEAVRDLNIQRQADLRKIDQSLGLIQDRTGVEVLKNRQMIDYYMQRVSQRQ
ncbi:MAG TPA: zf-HC2 domain-containing protein [Vicinamibacterales bacterium]|jgi:hypothetical protein|nr:zf-HC2 domain-containing protein [Vicinamibacterales bacterium]